MFLAACSGFSQTDWIVNLEKRKRKSLIPVRFPDRTEDFDTFPSSTVLSLSTCVDPPLFIVDHEQNFVQVPDFVSKHSKLRNT